MERIVFLDRKTCRAEFRTLRFQHAWKDYDLTSPGRQAAERIGDATIAITNKVPLREPELKNGHALRLIQVAATGVDVVDLDYCRAHNIAVCNVPGYTQHSVPEHVFALLLALRRNMRNYRSAVKAGLWSRSPIFSLLDYPIHDLAGSTLGIIGYGNLGKAVEKLALAFGMKVLIAERKNAEKIREDRTPFDDVLRQSDVLTLHCPLTPATRNLIGSTELTRMPPNAILINVARGGLVDETALAHALRTGILGGAALDVLSQEPPPADHPLLALDMPTILITPHIAWASEEAVRALADQIVSNLEAFVSGSPKNLVT